MHGFHHLHKRVRISRDLEPFPARGAWKRSLDYLMYGVGIAAPLALVPQILQIYTSKSASGLSLLSWLLLTFVGVLWTMYGAVHKDTHIFFANAFMILFNLAIVVGILRYQ